MSAASDRETDVVLIGAGIMSATLGVFLKELEPSLSIQMCEILGDCAQESSDSWNNAGTGHAANCEMNYTPQRPDGSIDISKALQVNVEFDLSRQFWSYLIGRGEIADPQAFIHPVPHMSFVHGAENVEFLGKRFKAMSAHHCYEGMEHTEDPRQIAEWAPLVMDGRTGDEPVAATRIITGTDVDYGSLTHLLVKHLVNQPGCAVHYNSCVTGLDREQWRPVARRSARHRERRDAIGARKVRLHRCRRRRAAVAGEIRYPGGARLWWFPGQRDLAALR
ncbi:malate:quinone-oxidoreductase [Bradyrhizobium sp. i1.3.6]